MILVKCMHGVIVGYRTKQCIDIGQSVSRNVKSICFVHICNFTDSSTNRMKGLKLVGILTPHSAPLSPLWTV